MDIVYEDFMVHVPKASGFCLGDFVECNMTVTLRQGFVLQKGIVVRVDDTDPGQDQLPLFFVQGLQTQVRSPLPLGSLHKSVGVSLKAKL